jgi:CRISPR/Cas system-associated exonuclease Cas4 (RecB family)
VSLLYDTRTEGLQTGEVSRFVYELRYQYGVPIEDKLVVFNISSTQPIALQVEKTEEVMDRMMAYAKGGNKALSASTINTYIDCPMKFYFSTIEGLKEEEEVSEQVDNKEFGTIFHCVAEWLYKPFCGSIITADLLKLREKEQLLTEAIRGAFSEKFFRSKEVQSLSGQHYLTGEMIRKYVLKLIENDRKLTPFRYIKSEEKIQLPFRLTNGMDVQLKGFIDRIDEVEGRFRVVDYKTGAKKALSFKTMESLFDPADEKRQSAVLQIFLYAFMYSQTDAVQPVLYYVRDFFSNSFDPVIYQGKEKESITDFAQYRGEFEVCLRSCLDSMFNPDIPFTQTFNTKHCGYCPFVVVCGR